MKPQNNSTTDSNSLTDGHETWKRGDFEKAYWLPAKESWLHKNTKAKKSVLKGLQQARQKKLKSLLT